jgi:hypothetical protein
MAVVDADGHMTAQYIDKAPEASEDDSLKPL